MDSSQAGAGQRIQHSGKGRGAPGGSLVRGHAAILYVLGAFLSAQIIVLVLATPVLGWDEAVYVGMGRYAASGATSGLWENIRPPVLPLVAGALWRIGLDPRLWTPLFVLATAVGSILLAHRLGRRWWSARAGLIAAMLIASTPLFFAHSTKILTEVPSAFLLMLAVWLLDRDQWLLAGVSVGLATLTRFPQGLFVLAIGAVTLQAIVAPGSSAGRRIDAARRLATCAAGVLLIVIPYLVVNASLFARESSSPFQAAIRPLVLASWHQNNPFEGLPPGPYFALRSLLFYPYQLAKGSPATLIGCFLAILVVANSIVTAARAVARSAPRWTFDGQDHRSGERAERPPSAMPPRRTAIRIAMAMAVITALYLTVIPNKQPRFLLTILPFLALIAGWSIDKAWTALRSRRLIEVGAPAWFVLFLFVSFAFSVSRVTIQANRALASRDANAARSAIYAQLDETLAERPGLVVTSDPVFAAYSSRRFIPFYDAMQIDDAFPNPGDGWGVGQTAMIVYTPASFPCRAEMIWCAGREQRIRERMLSFGTLVRESCQDDQCWYFIGPDPPAPKKEEAAAPLAEPSGPATKTR